MKSYVTFVQGLYNDIFEDIAVWFPSLREELRLDKSRLLSLIEERGLSFVTIDLPELGKHFEKCLSSSSYCRSGLAGSRPFRSGGKIPRLFKGLYLRIFDEFGVLRLDADVIAIRALRQLFLAAKKLKMECDDERIWQQVAEFYSIEAGIRSGTRKWDQHELEEVECDRIHLGQDHIHSSSPAQLSFDFEAKEERDGSSAARLDSIQQVCDIVSACLGRFDAYSWRTKHGPGAVADGERYTSKYVFRHWPAKLERVYPMADFAFANYALWAEYVANEVRDDGRFSRNCPPSVLVAVPKTQKGPRLIAKEPAAHLWCQQALWSYFANRIARTPISGCVRFRDQTRNQDLALRASQSQSHWTIDLSSASDRLSCWVVERVFRRNEALIQALHASRTRWIENRLDKNSPKYHLLRKFSTAGSACTFPVQTIVFACIAIGSLLYSRGSKVSIRSIRAAAQEVRIFGDDIIVPDDVGSQVLLSLGHLGFKVNASKTFGSGKFRESCGMDAYDGVCVTPVYSSTYAEWTRPESIISWIETRNNFYRSGFYVRAARMESMLTEGKLRCKIPNVSMGSGQMGWIRDDVIDNSHLKSRWNDRLHRREFLIHSPKGRSKKGPDHYAHRLLQYFTEAPDPRIHWESGVAMRPSLNLRLRWEAIDRVAC